MQCLSKDMVFVSFHTSRSCLFIIQGDAVSMGYRLISGPGVINAPVISVTQVKNKQNNWAKARISDEVQVNPFKGALHQKTRELL